MKKQKGKGSYILLYTVLFCCVAAAVFSPFLAQGRSLICRIDGKSQYFVYLRYMGQYLRSVLGGALQGDFTLPQFDFSIGMGDDINAIVRFHPLDLLSVFVPAAYTEQLYAVIMLLRMYLAGLSFSLFALYFRREYPVTETAVLTGSLVYVFCGYMLIRCLNHPTYAAPFIILPLLLLGTEKVLRGEGYVLFPAAVLLGFWSNYYFMYICTFALLLYWLLRRALLRAGNGVKGFFLCAGKTAGLYLIGMSASMLTFLPAILRYRESYRTSQTSVQKSLLVFADRRRYIAWFLNLISPVRSSGNGLALNFAVTILPAVCVLFAVSRKKYRTLRWSLLLCLVFLLVPFFGYLFAGMNNENNRWVFLISLGMGMSCVFGSGELADVTKKKYRAVLLVSLLYVLMVAAEYAAGAGNRYNLTGAAELVLCDAVLLVLWKKKASAAAVQRALLILTVFSVCTGGIMTYAPGFGNVSGSYAEWGEADRTYTVSRMALATATGDDSFYRTDSADLTHGLENSGEYLGYRGVSMYNSILNRNLIAAMSEENNIGLDGITQFHDFDARPVSLALAHVKYFACRQDDSGMVPYGFSDSPVLEKGGYSLYGKECMLPFGFSCGKYMTAQTYASLSSLEKEYVKLYALVLPDDRELEEQARAAGMTEFSVPELREKLKIDEAEVPLPESGEHMTRTARGYQVSEGEASLTFTVSRKAGTQTFLNLEGFGSAREWDSVRIFTDDTTRTASLRTDEEKYTIRRKDFLINLGFSETDCEENVTVRFAYAGEKYLDSIRVLSVPMAGYESAIASLSEEGTEKETVSGNRITASIRLTQERAVVFSVLSQKGWILKVDGERQSLFTADGCFLGAVIPPGEHDIELVYETPGLKAGALLTAAGVFLLILLAVFGRRKKRIPVKK